jgi:hypothetical protein
MAGLMLATCLATGPAMAAGLLDGVLGGSSGTASTTSAVTNTVSGLLGGGGSGGGLASGITNTVGGLLGGSSSSTSIGVPGVATASVSSTDSGTAAQGTMLNGGGSTLNVGLHGVLGDSSNVGVTLPGTGIAAVDNLTHSVTSTVNGLTGNGGAVDQTVGGLGGLDGLGLGGLLGGGGAGTGGGGTGTRGGTGANGGGGAAAGGGFVNRFFGGRGNELSVANLGALRGIACGAREARAITGLIEGHRYDRHTLGKWRRAANVQVVPVRVCPQLRASLRREAATSGTMRLVQSMAAADPLVNASLGRARLSAGNVLAVDQARGMLTVFVY